MKERKRPAGMVIPQHRLPPGFTDSIGRDVVEPAVPRPAATVILLRDGEHGPEALLLRRQLRTGFVPGAYVFPGGTVDPADGDVRLAELVTGIEPPAPSTPAAAATRGHSQAEASAGALEPSLAYWVAAARELFEETGVLLARTAGGEPAADAHSEPALARARSVLLEDRSTMYDVLRSASLTLDFSAVVYFAHWITPVVEPRRFDTRFFMAALPPGQRAEHDPREMDDAVWLTPAAALARFHEGTLPMVFPTVHSLELISDFPRVDQLLAAFRGCEVRTVLPRLGHAPDGVVLIVDPEET